MSVHKNVLFWLRVKNSVKQSVPDRIKILSISFGDLKTTKVNRNREFDKHEYTSNRCDPPFCLNACFRNIPPALSPSACFIVKRTFKARLAVIQALLFLRTGEKVRVLQLPTQKCTFYQRWSMLFFLSLLCLFFHANFVIDWPNLFSASFPNP